MASWQLGLEDAIGAGEPCIEVLLVTQYFVGTKETDCRVPQFGRVWPRIVSRDICDLLVEPRSNGAFDTVAEIVLLLAGKHHRCDIHAPQQFLKFGLSGNSLISTQFSVVYCFATE